MGDLRQQLSEAWTENKLLKRLQRRHMVALQHFQESEGSISQVGPLVGWLCPSGVSHAQSDLNHCQIIVCTGSSETKTGLLVGTHP